MGREWRKEARAIKVAVADGGRIRMTTSSGGCAREKINEPFSQLAGPTKMGKKGRKVWYYLQQSVSFSSVLRRATQTLSVVLPFLCLSEEWESLNGGLRPGNGEEVGARRG